MGRDERRQGSLGVKIYNAGAQLHPDWPYFCMILTLVQLLELNIDRIPGGGLPFGLAFRVLRVLWRKMTPAFHRWADQRTGGLPHRGGQRASAPSSLFMNHGAGTLSGGSTLF